MKTESNIREAVGVFHDEEALFTAADELQSSGFDRSDLALLASRPVIEGTLERRYRKIAELEDDPTVPTMAYVGVRSRREGEALFVGGLAYVAAIAALWIITAAGHELWTTIPVVLIASAAGVFFGVLLTRHVEQRHARYLERQLRLGGLLLWVRTLDSEHEKRACEILRRNGADDVHVHEIHIEREVEESGVSRTLTWLYKSPLQVFRD